MDWNAAKQLVVEACGYDGDVSKSMDTTTIGSATDVRLQILLRNFSIETYSFFTRATPVVFEDEDWEDVDLTDFSRCTLAMSKILSLNLGGQALGKMDGVGMLGRQGLLAGNTTGIPVSGTPISWAESDLGKVDFDRPLSQPASLFINSLVNTGVATIQIGTTAAHGLLQGSRVVISGVTGVTAANGTWYVYTGVDATHPTGYDSTHFAITQDALFQDAVTGGGTYSVGAAGYNGTVAPVVAAWVMGWYRHPVILYDTAAAAVAAGASAKLGRCRLDETLVIAWSKYAAIFLKENVTSGSVAMERLKRFDVQAFNLIVQKRGENISRYTRGLYGNSTILYPSLGGLGLGYCGP